MRMFRGQFSPNKYRIFTAVLLSVFASSLSAVVLSDTQTLDVKSSGLACKSIKENDKRLACYDRLFAQTLSKEDLEQVKPQIEKSTVTSPALASKIAVSKSKTPLAIDTSQDKTDNFGADRLPQDEDKNAKDELSEITAVVSSVTESLRGKRTFFLANGQVWKESENSRIKVKEGTQVVISKGVFSAYYLKREGSNRTVRVSRIK